MAKIRSAAATSSAQTNALLSGTKWTERITFGFPAEAPEGSEAAATGVRAASPGLKGAVRRAIEEVEGFTRLDLVERADGAADLQIREASRLDLGPGGSVVLGAYAFLPGTDPLAGDMFFGADVTGDLSVGSYGYRAVLHELGHALGLKQPDENGPYGRLDPAHDGPEHTVMTARTAPGHPVADGLGAEPGGHAQTYMPADIAALQALYGADYGDRRDTRYTFDPDERVMLRTIWDGGGHDTYDFSGYRADLVIDLAPGAHSTTGQEPQLNRAQELSEGAEPIFAAGAVHNADLFEDSPRSRIEDAIAGRGDDAVHGNAWANRLQGRLGDDTLHGGAGADTLDGQHGNDRLQGGHGSDELRGQHGDDRLIGGPGRDILRGALGADAASGGASADTLFGSHGDDVLAGDDGPDRLFGEAGDDALFGGFRDDRLVGGNGDDGLFGGAGDDVLIPGRGSDRLCGGPGDDLFVLTGAAFGEVTIADFARGDVIDVDAPRHALARARQVDGEVDITLGSGGTLRLLDVELRQLSVDDFL